MGVLSPTIVNGTLSVTGSIDINGVRVATLNDLDAVRQKLKDVASGAVTTITENDLNGITTFRPYAFCSCANLQSVVIPASVTLIEDSAFYDCPSLNSVTVLASSPPQLANYNAFSGSNCLIYVPAESVATYKAATNWIVLSSRIRAIPQ